ncbi:MAG: TRAP transporter small permease [Lachnospiraceae bacterium]|nr:TRAP transporter small permease [Lachnospiraceae bacterium]
MKIVKWLDNYFEEVILVALLIGMMIIMGIQVTARYAFSYSLTWSEEITRYMFIWSGFLSISFCIKKGASIKIEQFVGLFSPRTRSALRLVSYTVEIILFTYMIPFAWHYIQNAVASHQVSPAVGIPMYLMQSSTLISFCLADFRLVQKWIQRFLEVTGKREIEVKGE